MNSLTAFLTAVVIAVTLSTTSLSYGGNEPTSIGPAVEGTIETESDDAELIGPPVSDSGDQMVREQSCNSCTRR